MGCGRQDQEFDPAYHTHYTRIEDPDRGREAKTKETASVGHNHECNSENILSPKMEKAP